MHKINEIIKGFLIGIANIIPGVSGGTLAVLVGVYDTLTYNIGQIFSHPLKAIKSLLFIILGMVLGVVSGYFIIGKFLLLVLPLEMSFLFAGLILGGIKEITNEIKGYKVKTSGVILFIFSFSILISLAVLKTIGIVNTTNEISFNLINGMIFFGLGAISACSMIVPGISGSVVLLALGYYQTIISLIGLCAKEIFSFSFGSSTLLMLCFGLGILLALVFSSKLINFFLKRFHYHTYTAILGLIFGSIFAVGIVSAVLKNEKPKEKKKKKKVKGNVDEADYTDTML